VLTGASNWSKSWHHLYCQGC